MTDRDAIWVKAITRRTDKATLTCPLGHVIYGPLFLVGARAQNDSTLIVSGSDCRGFAQNTLTQVTRIFKSAYIQSSKRSSSVHLYLPSV